GGGGGRGVWWREEEGGAQGSGIGTIGVAVPTGVHARGEVHDTLVRLAWLGFAGLGVGWIDHNVPFHASASVRTLSRPPKTPEYPTAVQAVADVHDTEAKTLTAPRVGVGWIDHGAPFHTSARGGVFPVLRR